MWNNVSKDQGTEIIFLITLPKAATIMNFCVKNSQVIFIEQLLKIKKKRYRKKKSRKWNLRQTTDQIEDLRIIVKKSLKPQLNEYLSEKGKQGASYNRNHGQQLCYNNNSALVS